ncbi:helix-turn-helix domain-containing protein [Streptomyces olivaceoviridis]|uniref:helix-turn-helix domain-containing protein n=1 Tax=Streptomyces olivaceoviridis TaxID=1921 RepID=UPI00369B6CEE
MWVGRLYPCGVRYADGGGSTPEGRRRRESVRMQAAELYEQKAKPSEVARRLRVSVKSAYRWHQLNRTELVLTGRSGRAHGGPYRPVPPRRTRPPASGGRPGAGGGTGPPQPGAPVPPPTGHPRPATRRAPQVPGSVVTRSIA